ncbi:hypothetical protein B0H34DRAFT_733391 [Crassisporium funariophilum]|nr:hypothetical protein B0H34DRAFT_733391 [Crassisporium funariophilum]
MNFNEIPDDVWIEIFENIHDPSSLAPVVRTCRRFRDLATKPFLREIRWGKQLSTARNIEAWKDGYKNLLALPRKLTLSIPFDTHSLRSNFHVHPEDRDIYDTLHFQIPFFTGLHELVFDNTSISPLTYSILALLPGLRYLSVTNCKFLQLHTSSEDHSSHNNAHTIELFPFETLPITHLSLHKISMPSENGYNSLHPLHLMTAANLTSLSLTWNANNSLIYSTKGWQHPKLTHLGVVMPLFTRDLIDSLVSFVQNCPQGPRIELCIDRHNLSDQQIGSVHFPLRGVVSYKGPLPLAMFTGLRLRSPLRDHMGPATLTQLVMNEPLELRGLLSGLENLPRCLKTLDLQVRGWDIELLFAVRALFPGIRSLIVRYGKGTFSPDFLVTLGSDILFDLKSLHTIKLLLDRSCVVTSRQLSTLHQSYFSNPFALPIEVEDEEMPDVEPISSIPMLEPAELKDYLIGWNRYCKSLRLVQLSTVTAWQRRFEGDRWVEKRPVC